MQEFFGVLPSGETASLYTISCGSLTAAVSDYGATLVKLLIPDPDGNLADVVLGYDDCNGYRTGTACLGATVGRNANRTKNACFILDRKTCAMTPNENGNNLHSGPDYFFHRMWQVVSHTESAITLELHSPHGDQGFPGNAVIRVTYALEPVDRLVITYKAVSDKDTVFNLTNHSYFNLAG
ncbi:MAG: galactose-1-epimerase, partial [Faecousia sp.]